MAASNNSPLSRSAATRAIGCGSYPIYGREQAESAGTVQAGQPFETLAVGPGLLGDDRLTVDISVCSASSRPAAVNRKFLNPDDALVDVVDAAVGADFDKDLAHRG